MYGLGGYVGLTITLAATFCFDFWCFRYVAFARRDVVFRFRFSVCGGSLSIIAPGKAGCLGVGLRVGEFRGVAFYYFYWDHLYNRYRIYISRLLFLHRYHFQRRSHRRRWRPSNRENWIYPCHRFPLPWRKWYHLRWRRLLRSLCTWRRTRGCRRSLPCPRQFRQGRQDPWCKWPCQNALRPTRSRRQLY